MINKSYIKKIILALLIMIIGMTFVMGNNQVYAANSSSANTSPESGITSFFSISSFPQLINSAFAGIINLALGIAGFLVSIAGYLLDVSIRLTLHIKDFVEATPVIYSVWKILRDVTGLFFIFYLLYASILMITGVDTSKFGKTLKDIVLAGILINFSFFIVSLGIDASNVVSQSIYNAMLPNRQITVINEGTKISDLVKSSGKSDISNIFMNSLKIQQIYDSKGNKLGTNISDPIKMVLIGIAGIMMMIATAVSFVFASIAFIARLVILLFILAFSPIIFAARVLPNLSEKAKEITKILQDQLIFMPVYLLLMYVGLRILNESNMFGAGNISNGDISATGTNWALPYIILAINFIIVMFVLNLPLAVGLSMGGMATGFMKNKMGNWSASKIWGRLGNQTLGRTANAIHQSNFMRKITASDPMIGGMAARGLSNVVSYDFGVKKGSYKDILATKNKRLEEQYKYVGGGAERGRYPAGAEGDQVFAKAKEKAKQRQVDFVKGKSSILNTIFSSRAEKNKIFDLKEEVMLDENKKQKEENDKRLEKLKENMNRPEYKLRVQLGLEEKSEEESKAEIEKLEKENSILSAAIKRASGKKDAADYNKKVKEVFDKYKKDEEKEEEKPKEEKKP